MRLRVGVLSLLSFLAVFTGTAWAADLIVIGYGAEYEDIIRRTVIQPFEQRYNVHVVYDTAGSASQNYAKIRASRGAPGYDVVVMTASESLRGCDEKMLEPLTAERVPNMRHLFSTVQSSVGACGAVHELQYMGLLYRKDQIPEPPNSWSALADPRYRGRLVLPRFENVLSLYLAMMLSKMEGGSIDDPENGFAYFAKIAPNAMMFESSSSLIGKPLEEGAAWLTPFWSARGLLLASGNKNLALAQPREGTVPLLATLNIPIGAQNKDLAYKFVDFWLEKRQQEAWAQAYMVGTIRDDVELPADFRANQITSVADFGRLQLPDQRQIGAQRGKWAARFQREVASQAQ